MAAEVKIPLAEPVELVEELVELLVEPELMVHLVERAERNQRVALAELAQAAVPEVTVLMVLQTQVELELMDLVEVEEVPVCMVVEVEQETMMVEPEVVAVPVSEIPRPPAQERLRGTTLILTVVLPVKEARVVLAAARVAMETLAAL